MMSLYRLLLWVLLCSSLSLHAHQRVKDIATIAGVRPNQLVGYGLVVGLDGSGDRNTETPYTTQSLHNLLTQLGVRIPNNMRIRAKNVAAVTVTATLPPFARQGQTMDVTVSSIGDARSLRGGTLLFSALRGADGEIYAVAQGNIIVGGVGVVSGRNRSQTNHLNAGRIPGGATVERELSTSVGDGGRIQIELKDADFTMADRVARTIGRQLKTRTHAVNARLIEVRIPAKRSAVGFISKLENLRVEEVPKAPLVVVNSRTGSVVMNESVQITPVAVAHGGISIDVRRGPEVSQPAPFSNGVTVITEDPNINIRDRGGRVYALGPGARLDQVVKALNTVGATPQDLISILEAMKSAGALKADLEVI